MAPIDQWHRHVMNEKVAELITLQGPAGLDTLEISGTDWADFGFKSYRTVEFPAFDICKHRLMEKFDLIIAEQVFEHIPHPARAARNIRSMLRPNGMFVITTPFLIKYHPCPNDYYRWTKEGLVFFLEENGFTDILTDSWGNHEAAVANLDPDWVMYEPGMDLTNELEFPMSVWGFGRRPGRREDLAGKAHTAKDMAARASWAVKSKLHR